jgi:hypothetical protein
MGQLQTGLEPKEEKLSKDEVTSDRFGAKGQKAVISPGIYVHFFIKESEK